MVLCSLGYFLCPNFKKCLYFCMNQNYKRTRVSMHSNHVRIHPQGIKFLWQEMSSKRLDFFETTA